MILGVNGLNNDITFIYTCISYIPDCGCLHNVPNHKLLDSLVLGDTSCTVCTTYKFDMSTAMLATPTVTPLLCLLIKNLHINVVPDRHLVFINIFEQLKLLIELQFLL